MKSRALANIIATLINKDILHSGIILNMFRSAWKTAIPVIVLVYLWLGYSMIILRAPILSMLVYYLLLCLGGGTSIRHLSPGVGVGAGSGIHQLPKIPHPVIVTVSLAALSTAGIWAVSLLFRPGLVDPEIIRGGLRSFGMDGPRFWFPAGILILLNPSCEEYLWRLSVLPLFLTRFRVSNAVALKSMLFAGYHVLTVYLLFPHLWLIGVFLFVYLGGIILGYLFLRTHSIVYPIAIHTVINVNLMVLGYRYSS
jgi:membrane protease YdiL (CAAX protease family)